MSMTCELFIVPAETARQVVGAPATIHKLLQSLEKTGSMISLEKSWHGLHFVLSGHAWGGDPPLNFIAGGGVTVGDEDVGYGPARVLDEKKVADLDKALEAISEEEFAHRFDPTSLEKAEIYPQIWDEPLEELKQEYGGYYRLMKQHIRASQSGQALLIAIM